MKPSAPAPLPSRREAPKTRSEITRQAAARADRGETAPSDAVDQEADDEADDRRQQDHPPAGAALGAGGAGEHADRDADAEVFEKIHGRKPNGVGARRRQSATLPCMTEVPQPPHKRRAHTSHPRPRALRRALRRADHGDALLGDARPDGGDRAAGSDLAGRRPARHLDLPAREPRRADEQDRRESAAAALQYGPTEGFDETKDCIVEVMAAEGMLPDPDDIVVTTGGQQAIDLVTKTLVDPGDVVICEAPTYPGAVPVFCSYQADVRQVEMDERRDADRPARRAARRSCGRRAGGRSSSTRCRASRTRAG